MARTRQTKLPVDGSWRMVEEGENDSFDTSIIQDPFEDDFQSSGQTQFSSSSQGIGSQDSIRDFANMADEDQVILRAPFQPSFISSRHASADKEHTPVPEFFMPTPEIASARNSSGQSSRTIRPEDAQVRKRVIRPDSTGIRFSYPGQGSSGKRRGQVPGDASQMPTVAQRFGNTALECAYGMFAWTSSVLGLVFRLMKYPIAIILAAYLGLGLVIMIKNMMTQSITASLSPICRVPGVSTVLPLCSSAIDSAHVEFQELMSTQDKFEKVLEDSAQGVSLPMDMKRSEASVRDLRTMVKYSDLPSRDELVFEFDGYVDTVRQVSSDLQSFNTHVGSAVDNVISINRWTSRYIDSVAASRESHSGLIAKVFWPFQPAVFNEQLVVDKYIEHTALVSDKIASLILEAQMTLGLLKRAEDHLAMIHENVVRSDKEVSDKRSEVLWDLWTLVGANNGRLHNLKAQLSLLRQVESQRTSAVSQLTNLILDLGDIQTKLSDLRDRVAAPELLQDRTSIPLIVHIETINAGVERLETARSRIRAEENERLQAALARAREDDRLIEG
ncbi:hypothetical protein F5Y18DRAFT_71708 [Xylariaceae sp. FL1019]|nr:hypothetical protein F5Y18DRAFT_71708 [Xylariaceae sp. FL1019]